MRVSHTRAAYLLVKYIFQILTLRSNNGFEISEADIKATIEVLANQVSKYELDNSTDALADFCSYEDEKGCVDLACKFRKDDKGDIIFTFGSNKGKKIKDNLGMLKWMLDKDFSQDTKDHAKKLLEEFSRARA